VTRQADIPLDPPQEGVWSFEGLPQAVQVAGRQFRRTESGTPKPGVIGQYREDKSTNSTHLYVHADGRWAITHLDEFNPDKGRVLEHFVTDVIAQRVADRYAARPAFGYIRVYHGTQKHKLGAIRSKGLVSGRGYEHPKWFMVAEDFRSAADHAKGYEGEPVVVEFRIPSEGKERGGKLRKMWDGFPYLWAPQNINWEGSGATRWWALRQAVSASFIRGVHDLD